MKHLLTLILLVTLSLSKGIMAQSIIKDTANVKKPAEGKLYYAKNTQKLYLYRKSFEPISTAAMPGGSEATPPVTNPPTAQLQEIPIGYWNAPDKILIAKTINGKYYLMQTNPAQDYYVPRGKNLLNDPRTKINSDIFTGDIVPAIVSTSSDLGGLYPASNFPEAEFLKLGYTKNTQGEFVKTSVAPITNPPITNPPVTNPDKISIPVGLIMWDNWSYDYWADPNPKYDYLINHISRNRYTATFWGDKFNLVPFWGQHTAPEKVKIRFNVKWNQSLGRNTYDEIEKTVTVKYDKTAADTEREVKYYRDAGFDFLVFNYYNVDSYLSETRQHFQSMPNKLGMKMTIMCMSRRSDTEIDQITTQMLKDYWFRIDNKPVLYMVAPDFDDLPKYRASLKAKGGSDIYVVYYNHNGYPIDWSDYLSKGNNAISAYNTSIGGYATQEQQIQKEIADRENWMGQFKATHVQLIPVLSLGIENLDNRTDLPKTATYQDGVVESANPEQIGRKSKLMQEFIKKYPEKIPAIIWYSGTELNEGGRSFVPKKLKNGSIDTTELDAVKAWQN